MNIQISQLIHFSVVSLLIFTFGNTVYGETNYSFSTQAEVSAYKYHIIETKVPWNAALISCHSSKGSLVAPVNPVENNDLRIFLLLLEDAAPEAFWIAGRASIQEDKWYWEHLTNLPILWKNFYNSSCQHAQTGNCLAGRIVLGEGLHWCGMPCDMELPYVCQFGFPDRTTTATPDTTVDSPNMSTLLKPGNLGLFCLMQLAVFASTGLL